jgi:hypothetical protein
MPRDTDKPPKDQPRKPRRTKAAADLEHLIPGGKDMTDDQLEIALDWLLRPNK